MSLLPATKTLLPPAVLAGLAANPLALLAARLGFALPAWFTAEPLVGAGSVPRLELRLIRDHGPRRPGALRVHGLPWQWVCFSLRLCWPAERTVAIQPLDRARGLELVERLDRLGPQERDSR